MVITRHCLVVFALFLVQGLAYQSSEDDLAAYHTDHSPSLSLLIVDPEAPPPEEPVGGEPGPGAQPKSTSLSLRFPTEAKVNGEVFLSAKLTDEDGVAVKEAVVDFYVNTTFGEVKVGSAITDEEGVAVMKVIRRLEGTIAVRAEHVLTGGQTGGKEVRYITIARAHVAESNPLYWAFPVTQVLVAIVVGSVFSVYAFVLYQVGQISRSSSRSRTNS